jgi:hypothetical protein
MDGAILKLPGKLKNYRDNTKIISNARLRPEVGRQTLLKVLKWQIRKILHSFRYGKSTNFLDVPVRKSPKFANFYDLSTKIANRTNFYKYCTTLSQNSPKSRFLTMIFYLVQI